MQRLVTAEEMKACDQFTIETIGIPSMVLMERASLSVVANMQATCNLQKVLVVCGTGNNGGDGLAIARLLHLQGIPVTILLVGKTSSLTPDAAQQLAICRYYQLTILTELPPNLADYTTIVDAIFGIGLARPITGNFAEIIQQINQVSADIVAVDLPSGISCNDGKILGVAIKATLTVTFAFNKIGLTLEPGKTYAGKTIVTDIGIYDDALNTNN